MILAILQARVSSTRLPGKVLKPILGKPMIVLEIERILRSKKIDKLVIATSIETSDDELEKLCKDLKLPCFRGSLDDVLDRFYQTAQKYKPEHVVRLTGDCPLIDPTIIDNVIDFYFKGNYDYASNCFIPTFPDGLDVEVFKFSVLEKAWKKSVLPSQREHVTLYINKNPSIFNIGNYANKEDLSHLRWTVDEQEDFEFANKVYEALYKKNPEFSTEDVLQFLDKNSSLSSLNNHIKRNEGIKKSLVKDEAFKEKNI